MLWVKQTALMESLSGYGRLRPDESSNLHNFLKQIGKNLSLPDKKSLPDALVGLIRAGWPIVCQMTRCLPNQRTKFLSRRDRLEEHLTKDSKFEDAVKQSLQELWLPFNKDDTPIILDLSDIAKPSVNGWITWPRYAKATRVNWSTGTAWSRCTGPPNRGVLRFGNCTPPSAERTPYRFI